MTGVRPGGSGVRPGAPGAQGATRAASLAITGPIRRADLEGLSLRVCGFFSRCAGSTVSCDVSGVPADAVTVEALARLQWVARKYGCTVVLQRADDELRGLVTLMGLSHVLLRG